MSSHQTKSFKPTKETMHSDRARIGRGATGNVANRFEQEHVEEDLESLENEIKETLESDPSALIRAPKTQFLKDQTRTIFSRNKSPDIPFDVSVNPYRGCEHGCAYCYARPTHEYLGMSAGLDFESRIIVKENAPELLCKEISSPKWIPKPVTFSGVTDCYQPIERKLQITRRCIEVLTEFKNPFSVITKNALVTRDIDMFCRMADIEAVAVFISITSLNPDLCAKMEPRTSRPQARLEAVAALAQAKIPVGVMTAPMIPGINDHEMPAILKAAAEAGAQSAGFVMLRLPWAVRPIFEHWLEQHFPDRKEHVLSLIRSVRDGKLNDYRSGTRMSGEGVYAKHLADVFRIHTKLYGLNKKRTHLSTEHFERQEQQLRLF